MSNTSILSIGVGALLLSTSIAFARDTTTDTLLSDMAGGSIIQAVVSRGPPSSLFPQNVDCRDFDRTGEKTWGLRKKEILDLGNWDGAFTIDGPILPRSFVRKGIDLFDVLESKCGIYAVRH